MMEIEEGVLNDERFQKFCYANQPVEGEEDAEPDCKTMAEGAGASAAATLVGNSTW